MSEFYENLVNHYDTIFPAEPEIVAFLSEALKGKRRVLDIACGTGSYALELAARGYQVTGIDLDGSMIERAREKAGASDLVFHQADMMSIDFPGESGLPFDGAYCIGNSLPHLGDLTQVAAALRGWHSLLAPGGVLLVQTVNFGRFKPGAEPELPSISADGIVFSRRYTAGEPGSVNFVTSLEIPGVDQKLENSVRLLALDRSGVDSAFRDAGFDDLDHFGNYNSEEYDEKSSFLMICRGRRR